MGDDGHHNQAGGNVLHVAESFHGTNASTNESAKDNEIQSHGDRWRQQGLDPDASKAPDFLNN
jgi:hypothetical protein